MAATEDSALTYRHDASLFRGNGGLDLWSVTGSKLIDSLLDAMRSGEVTPYDSEEDDRTDRELANSARLQTADFSQGSASLARYRSIVGPTRASVVVVLNAGVGVSLGTVVGAEGWVITKASELPAQPTCRLPDGKVVSARVAGVDAAFDLALLSVPVTDLKPVRWADDFNPPVGTLLAAVGTENPLAVGIVSVARRDLGAPVRPTDALPLRIPAGRPKIHGDPRPMTGYSLHAALGLPRATIYHVRSVFGLACSAGVREHDLLYSINGRRILAEADVLEAVHHRRAGDVVPVRLERAGKMMDLMLPLRPKLRDPEELPRRRLPDGDRVRGAVRFRRVRRPHCEPRRAHNRDHDRQARTARRHGNPRRLRSEVIARFAEWPISRKLVAGSSSWQLRARRYGTIP